MAKVPFLLLLMLFLGMAIAIPQVYESMTLWYKFGTDRLLLKAAQSAGMIAFVLFNAQVLLAVKGKWLTAAFGAARINKYHQTSGVLIALFGVAHVLLVLLPEGLGNLPFGFKFWPEMVGALLLLLLGGTVVLSRYRRKFKLPYPLWRNSHKVIGYLLIVLLNIHVLFVSDTFEQPVPRLFLGGSLLLLVVWVGSVKACRGIK